MSIRLTAYQRKKICQALLGHRFGAEALRLEAREAAFGERLYQRHLGNETLARVRDIPAGWLPVVHGLYGRFGEITNFITFGKGNEKSIPKSFERCAGPYDDNDELTIENEALNAAKLDLRSSRRLAEVQIMAVLNSHSTLAKLIQTWPEVQPFTIGVGGAEIVNLPAIPLGELNTTLNLKRDAA